MAFAFRRRCKIHPPLARSVLFVAIFFCQITVAQTDEAQLWKSGTVENLNTQISRPDLNDSDKLELTAQHRWLTHWKPGQMESKPARSLGATPPKRQEPRLQSVAANQLAAAINTPTKPQTDEGTYARLKQAACCHPNDPAVHQTVLRWLDDDPTRRKAYLNEIEVTATNLVSLLKRSLACCPDEQCQRALEFALYRRARALAYRELPDVVAKQPIKDPNRLNQQIQSAFDELIRETGLGRTEFVLLDIRMLRRDGKQGRALELLEQYGTTILPKWYQKKRRDLLRELKWTPAAHEAATIFAKNFPDYVANERQQNEVPSDVAPYPNSVTPAPSGGTQPK